MASWAAPRTLWRRSLCGNHALYVCVTPAAGPGPAEELGVDENPMGILDVLFTPVEQDQLGGDALRFLGLFAAAG